MNNKKCTHEESRILAGFIADEEPESIKHFLLLTVTDDEEGLPFITVTTVMCHTCAIRTMSAAIGVLSTEIGHCDVP